MAAALALAWFGFPAQDTVCGADGALLSWRLAHLQAAWDSRAALGLDGDVSVPLAGWPWSAVAMVLAAGLGVAAAWKGTLAIAFGAGAAALWGFSRAAGASLLAAGLATLVGVLPAAAARSVASGGVDLLVVPFVVAALVLLPRREPVARLVGALAVVACGACDARTGAVLGLAAAAAG
ncbi:MAG: hypothetical protein Q8P41_24860, partial [Pseudomonadota bacterium]|nr:hypothetical protein [Pseudomonadota bacterium]